MKIKIAALQLEALDLSQSQAALERSLALIDRAAERYQPDLMLTPECSYPAYVLGSDKEFRAAYRNNPLPYFAEKARKYQTHLCLGVATPTETDKGLVIYNEAVLLGPDGQEIGRTAKSLMWHFDSRWFSAGANFPVFETALGRIGMMICADGRMPEIARCLALADAQLILDPTAWVSYGTAKSNLSNPQADYMLATRAFENGVWCVAANKVGLERGTVLYAGRSCIVAPTGAKVAEGSCDREEIVFAEIELTPRRFSPVPRRPELYERLVTPTESLPVHALLQEPLVPHLAHFRGGVAQYRPFNSTQVMGETVRPLIAQFALESVELAVLPDVPPYAAREVAHRGEVVFPFYRTLSKQRGVALLATAIEEEGERRYKTARLFYQGQEIGVWRQTHFSAEDEGSWTPGAEIGPVVKLPGQSGARIGVMLGADGYIPEVARSLMLAGADVILWPVRAKVPGTADGFGLTQLARSRAAENRVAILCATPLETQNNLDPEQSELGGALIVDANGNVVAPALTDRPMGISTQISVAASREKLRAPNTNVVYNRKPESYKLLTQEVSKSDE
ncbi:MAG: carbon-nitrogen hydrolase family protein [Chloroflexi bacterium]|nr:carbon-nitrogen hydrolase family protein [Chloroflexota bacterium]